MSADAAKLAINKIYLSLSLNLHEDENALGTLKDKNIPGISAPKLILLVQQFRKRRRNFFPPWGFLCKDDFLDLSGYLLSFSSIKILEGKNLRRLFSLFSENSLTRKCVIFLDGHYVIRRLSLF